MSDKKQPIITRKESTPPDFHSLYHSQLDTILNSGDEECMRGIKQNLRAYFSILQGKIRNKVGAFYFGWAHIELVYLHFLKVCGV